MSPVGKGSYLAAGRTAAMVGFRDRNVQVRSVVCPTCGAAINESCTTSTGSATQHGSRRRMALRTEVRTWDPDDVRFARSLTASERRAVRRNNKLAQGDLARIIGVAQNLLSRWERGQSLPSTGEQAAAYGHWLREHRDVVVE